jgi:sarcosine oxidase subunit gamma
VADLNLYARTAFGGADPVSENWEGFTIREVSDHGLASVAARHGAEQALRAAVSSAFGVDLPGPGRSARGDAVTFDWMGQGQWFAETQRDDGSAFARELTTLLGESASITDQSDSWVQLQLSGANTRSVLEKLCRLDLHGSVFTPGAVTRTVIEHLGAIVALVDDSPRFKVLSARSSARSFLHALREAADSTCGPQ